MLSLMENIKLQSKAIPNGYEICFNDNCQLRDTCLHYQAYLLKSAERLGGPAVYPAAWQHGECTRYCEAKPVQRAWGFSQLYKNVPLHQKAVARQYVSNYFSFGCGPYYRYHHGENKLSPTQQQDIMDILATFGSTDGLAFDHYETAFDFS